MNFTLIKWTVVVENAHHGIGVSLVTGSCHVIQILSTCTQACVHVSHLGLHQLVGRKKTNPRKGKLSVILESIINSHIKCSHFITLKEVVCVRQIGGDLL